MVPKVAGKGRSFVGAGLYYLHDKKAETSERVAFTHTVNLPTLDADKAIRLMAYTAMHQTEIKARAGGSTRGRKLTDPVYCYSLSWAPGEEPSQEEMIGAAKETLKALGLDGHEALLVGHDDEPHPHIHIIVNRVNPETGIAAPLKMDHLKLSAWAEKFERNQGQIRCEQRVENNALRREGEFVKDKGSQHSAEFHRWRQERVDRQHDKRATESAVLDARHERERDSLRADRDAKIDALRIRVRDATRADWRDLFAIQRQEQGRLDKAQRNLWTRMRHYIRTQGAEFKATESHARKKMLKDALAALTGSRRQYRALEDKQQSDRIFFARALKARTEELSKGIKREHERTLAHVQLRQRKELEELRARQSAESQIQAREIAQGKDKEIFEKERREKRKSSLTEQFNTRRAAEEPGRDSGQEASQEKPSARPRKGLTDAFRDARGVAPNTNEKDRKAAFRSNAKDIGDDERDGRSRKPPGGSKDH